MYKIITKSKFIDWFAQYESLKEFNESYSENYDCLEDLEDFTTVIRINDIYGKPTSRFIVQVF